MLQTLPTRTKGPYSAFTDETANMQDHHKSDKKNTRRKSHFTEIADTCHELQSTVESIQRLVRLYPDCRTADADTQEQIMNLMNEILDQKSKSLNSLISQMLEIYHRKSGQLINEYNTPSGTESRIDLEEKRRNTLERPLPNEKNKPIAVYMDEEDRKRFTSISYHIGIAPSIMALVILKQAMLRAKDSEELEGLLLPSSGPSPQAPHLFPRESEILNLIAKGHSNREIARQLAISERTVKNHVTSIMRKMNAQNRTHAVIMAQQYRLV